MNRKQAIVRTNLSDIIRQLCKKGTVLIDCPFFLLIIKNFTLYLYGKKKL